MKWVKHARAFANKKGISYKDALKDSECKETINFFCVPFCSIAQKCSTKILRKEWDVFGYKMLLFKNYLCSILLHLPKMLHEEAEMDG